MWEGFAGAALGGGLSYLGQSSANEANIDLASKQAEWNRHNYKNRHRWEVADLKRAGLNPILAAMGNPGNVAPYQVIPMQNPFGGASEAFRDIASSAGDLMFKEKQKEEIDAKIKHLAQQVALGVEQAFAAQQKGYLDAAQRSLVNQQTAKVIKEYELVEAQTKGVELENRLKQIEVDFYSDEEWARILRQWIGGGDFINLLSKVFRGGK